MWKCLAVLVLSAAPGEPRFGLSAGDSGPARPAPSPPAPPQPADTCTAPRPPDRACTADSDCVAVWQYVGCCGTQAVRGINRSDVERFQAHERLCSRGRTC